VSSPPRDTDRRRVRALERWFARHARDLPWRRRRTGYRALVAEVMLQQTQVSRVAERYVEFLRRFPTVRGLAEADEQEVLAAWQGLGYYRRARNLHAAARLIVAERGGRIPRTVDGLRQLPGVGRYTAGAIASIVYGAPAPIVDGNVQRVIARWDANDAPPADASTVAETWRRAEDLVGATARPGVLNEALMELGATVCTPVNPMPRRRVVRGATGRAPGLHPTAQAAAGLETCSPSRGDRAAGSVHLPRAASAERALVESLAGRDDRGPARSGGERNPRSTSDRGHRRAGAPGLRVPHDAPANPVSRLPGTEPGPPWGVATAGRNQ